MDAADAAEAYRELLRRSGAELVEFGIAGLDRTGVPVHTVAAFLDGGRLRNGVGYGLDEQAAQASALGECLEVLCGTTQLPGPVPYDPASAMDPRELIPDAGADLERDRLWCRAERLGEGDTVLIPLEWAAHTSEDLPHGYVPLITPITNGLGVHPDRAAAIEHGVRELVQRDGNSVSFRALDRGIGVEAELEAPAPGIRLTLKAAECDLGLANVYVVGDDVDPPHPLSVTACGEAAAPDRDAAIAKAIREYAASHVRKVFNHGPLEPVFALAPARYRRQVEALDLDAEEPRALAAMLEWLGRSAQELRDLIAVTTRVERSIPLDQLPHDPGRTAVELLGERGFEVLVVDLTPPGDHGVHVVKAIVPGLEVETVSYGRCGSRNLDRLLERDLGLVGLGAGRPGTLPLRLPSSDGRSAWLDPEAVERATGPLYPLYREPSRHAAPLALAARARDAAPAGRR